jgi:hypothetical protein
VDRAPRVSGAPSRRYVRFRESRAAGLTQHTAHLPLRAYRLDAASSMRNTDPVPASL